MALIKYINISNVCVLAVIWNKPPNKLIPFSKYKIYKFYIPNKKEIIKIMIANLE